MVTAKALKEVNRNEENCIHFASFGPKMPKKWKTLRIKKVNVKKAFILVEAYWCRLGF